MTAPRIKLYGPPVAPYVHKVILALRLKGLAFELVEPASPDDYLRWNPEKGLLPVIEIDGVRTADSVVILDRLDERFPEPPLLSSDSRTARSQRQLEEWATETFLFYFLSWLRERFEGGEELQSAAPGGPLARMGLLRADGGLRTELIENAKTGLGVEFEKRLDDLVGFLGDRTFFYASQISRADLTVYVHVSNLLRGFVPGARRLVDARPALLAHGERVRKETGDRLEDQPRT